MKLSKIYREALYNFRESLKDNGITPSDDLDRRFDLMFMTWSMHDRTYEGLYGDDFMDPGALHSLVMEIVDEMEAA